MAAHQIKQQATDKRFKMFDSAESASFWFDIFNWFLLLGAFIVLVGTWGTIKTAAIKERFSDERVSENEAATKRSIADSDAAKEGTAKANERIAELTFKSEQLRTDAAEANERTKQAEVELAQLRKLSERRTLINRNSFIELLKDQPKSPTEIWYLREASDARWLADSFASAMQEAGWGFVPIKPIPDLDPSSDEYRRGGTNVTAAGGQATGITVSSPGGLSPEAEALMRAISRGTEFFVNGTAGVVPVPPGTLRVIIGNKIDPVFWPKGVALPGAVELKK